MHVLLLTRALDFGGAERQLVHLANGLAQRGHRVSILTFYPGAAFDSAFGRPNPSLVVLGKHGRWDIVGFVWQLLRRIRVLDPDVIYSFLPVPNLRAVLARALVCRRAGVICGVRGTPLDLTRYDWVERLTTQMQPRVHLGADLVIANSRASADWLRQTGLADACIAVIPNGIDTAAIQPASPVERLTARRQFGCDPEAIIVAVVARLDPMKDHETFFRAFSKAVAEEPQLRALVVGNGPAGFAATLRERAAALGIAGRIVWSDARHDVATVYHAADLLCLPSAFGEGFSNVLGEAMAAGIPCIATAVGESATILGPFGRVVPPRDALALAAAILDAARATRQNAAEGLELRRRVTEVFSIERMVASTEDFLVQIARRRRRPGG